MNEVKAILHVDEAEKHWLAQETEGAAQTCWMTLLYSEK